MRFTSAQIALFHHGVRFVHLSPDGNRMSAAQADFLAALEKELGLVDLDPYQVSCSARFVVCTLNGASVDHVPVMFIQDEADCDQRALAEALMIPAPDKSGCGPMVVR